MAFKAIDKDSTIRITFKEFSMAVPIMQKWGIDVKQPEYQWKSADKEGKGILLFDDFVDWACNQSHDVDIDES